MIGTQTPFRISFAGGGSDLRAFYSREPGRVLSTTINKYVYILIHPFFEQKYQIKYSRTEIVDSIDDIQHPVVREALRRFDKIDLEPGQKVTVRFELGPEDLRLLDEDMNWVVEPGRFEVMIGGLKKTFEVVGAQ